MFGLELVVLLLSLLLDVSCLRFVAKEFQRPQLQVKTETGRVQGVRLQSNVFKKGYYYAFLGIPYAEAPVGPLRFKSPKPAKSWSGVLNAGIEGSNCVEVLLRTSPGKSTVIGDENCLFLNVFTITNPASTKKLKPVMVFIHGGGYIAGNSHVSLYGPDPLLAKDVVVVTLNYRLGVFGFLSTEDLASPGNYGLKDQNMALRWVQKNIKHFGGDPDNVMLFGQSAGSTSVHFHLLSPKSRGLFHKVILESGTSLCMWASQRKPRNIAYLVGLANGITHPRDNEDLVERLRRIDLDTMKQTLLPIALSGTSQVLLTGLPFAPSFEVEHEDAFLTKNNWYEMLNNGEFNKVPVVMGMNSNESLFFLQEFRAVQPFFALLDLDVGLLTPTSMNITDQGTAFSVGSLIKDRFYGKETRISTTDLLDLLRYVTQDQFVRPIWKTAELMSRHVPLYLYYFKYESEFGRYCLPESGSRLYPGIKGVAHAEELCFLFNESNVVTKKKTNVLVRERMVTMWTNFAKYSDPTPIFRGNENDLEGIIWPKFAMNQSRTTFLEIDESLKVRDKFDEAENLLWWNELFDKYGNPPYLTY